VIVGLLVVLDAERAFFTTMATTDVAVHLRHLDVPEGKGPSGLGLQLAAALRSFGIVQHTVWGELQ